MARKILYYGNFNKDEKISLGGQTSKTRNFYNIAKKELADSSFDFFDTQAFRYSRLNIFCLMRKIIKNNVYVIFPGSIKNLKFILKLIYFFKRKPLVYYPVVGGWLFDKLSLNPGVLKLARKITCLYPETKALATKLSSLGIKQVKVIPTFSLIKPISFEQCLDLYKTYKRTDLRLVYFGRVSQKKGIIFAMEQIRNLNSKHNDLIKLDIFGKKQDGEDFQYFDKLCDFNIRYYGTIKDDDLQKLASYDFMIFPTFYEGEGLAATVIEALMFGTPIIASDYKYNGEVIQDGFNGYLFKTNDALSFRTIIKKISDMKIDDIVQLKRQSYIYAKKFAPYTVIRPFLDDLHKSLC